jgi:hypothetical protein
VNKKKKKKNVSQRREVLAAVGRREDQSPLCGFASLRLCVNKKKNVSPSAAADWTGSKEGKPRRSRPLCSLACLSADLPTVGRQAPLREINKKTLAKEDSLSQLGLFFFRAKAQRRKEI